MSRGSRGTMSNKPRTLQTRQIRQQFFSRVRMAIPGKSAVVERYAENISSGGLFIRTDTPEPVGSRIWLELTLPDGKPLCRLAGVVRHSRPASLPGERNAGMGIEISQQEALDGAIAERFKQLTEDKKAARKRRPRPTVKPRKLRPVKREGPVVGIDLGTSYSSVAALVDGEPRVLSNRGYQSIPSILFLDEGEGIDFEIDTGINKPLTGIFELVGLPGLEGVSFRLGHQAQEQMILQPGRAVIGARRFLGRPFASRDVKMLGHLVPCELVEGLDGLTAVHVGERIVPLTSVAATILTALRETAEGHFERPVHRAVISVPIGYGEPQRAAVREAAQLAGLYVERLINEPTAAALAFNHGRRQDGTFLVYDLGGGSLDVSLLRFEAGDAVVLAMDSDQLLCGDAFDDRILEFAQTMVEREHGADVFRDPSALQRLRFAVELAKRQLTEVEQTMISAPCLAEGPQGPIGTEFTLERGSFERLTRDLVTRSLDLVERVLAEAELSWEDLDDVVLVGGQTHSPHVQRAIEERLDRPVAEHIHPDEAVALGAALVAHECEQTREVKVTEILPASVRIARPDGSTQVLLARGTQLPASTKIDVRPFATEQAHITLYRGEAPRTPDNDLLGIAKLPKEWVAADGRLRASFRMSADGILTASLKAPDGGEERELALQLGRSES